MEKNARKNRKRTSNQPQHSNKTQKQTQPSKLKNALMNLALVLVTVGLFLGILEGVLRLNLISTSVYSSLYDLEDDNLTDARNNIFQVRHGQMLFNDRFRSSQKPATVRKRIIVVGDSFLQGTSIPYDTVWSHKLENRITKKYPDIEVITIGRSGWPTSVEFNAIQQLGMKYQPDLVIYGFVVNDLQLGWGAPHPDAGDYPSLTAMRIRYAGILFAKALKKIITPIFPECATFFSGYINQMMGNIALGMIDDKNYLWRKHGWGIYFSDSTYLKPFDKLLGNIAMTSQRDSIQSLFVLTPNNHHEYFEKNNQVIIPYFTKHNLPYVDTYPTVKAKLSNYTPHELKANPTDGHPGNLMNEIFADETYQYLEKIKFFD